MALEQDIAGWDGRSADAMAAIYLRHATEPGLVAALLNLCHRAELQKGATWLLKRHLETGADLDAFSLQTAVALLPVLADWESRLHCLQCLPFSDVDDTDRAAVEHFLRECLVDRNTFVRAWTYNAWHGFAERFPDYRTEVDAFFEMALRDEAPSVRARIRNIRKATD